MFFTLVLATVPALVAVEPSLNNLKIEIVENLGKTGYIDGHFIIGAMFPIHSSPSHQEGKDPLECGPIKGSEGIELVEAAFYAIDTINEKEHLLPGIKLGITVKDDCENELVALYQTIKLLEEPKLKDNTSTLSRTCNNTKIDFPLIGVLGSASSRDTLQAENLLKLFEIPQISYTTKSVDLNSPYFYLSVAPNDYHQTHLIIKMLKKFDWNYISVAYTNEHFRMDGRYFLEQWVSYYNICISNSVHVARPKEPIPFTHSVKQLFHDDRVRVVVCFCDETALAVIFEHMRSDNLSGKFLLLISHDWPIPESFLAKYHKEAHGSIMLTVQHTRLSEFEDYFKRLDPTNNKRNPWFDEYSKLKLSAGYEQNSKISYVIESMYAFAHGLRRMHAEVCGSRSDLCSKMSSFNTTKYMEHLTNLSFKFHGHEVDFRFNGSPYIGRFDIYNYQNFNNTNKYVKIGEYSCEHLSETEDPPHKLVIIEKIQFPDYQHTLQSTCSEPCAIDEIQVHNSDLTCCWSCISCAESEIPISETECQPCREGYWPNDNKTVCEEIPVSYTKFTEIRSLITTTVSIIFAILTLISSYVYVRHRDTPVVKSSHRELHYFALCGTFLLHISCISYTVKPCVIVCMLSKILPTLGITLIYVPVTLMAGQIARMFDQSKKKDPNLNLRMTSLRAQMIILAITVIMEAILYYWEFTKGWFDTVIKYEIRPHRRGYLSCNSPLIRLSNYLFFCIHALMTYYAVKIRKITNNFNEAKFIAIFTFVQGFNTITLRIAYTSSEYYDSRGLSVIICLTLSGLASLLFLILPKLYIILWQPEKNTSENFKPLIQYYATN